MPRINFIRESDIDAEARALIASAERTGAPDPRVVRIMARSGAGRAWVKCWNSVLYEGRLPHKLKEMCRIRISVAHKCGYCATVRSNVARADGLTGYAEAVADSDPYYLPETNATLLHILRDFLAPLALGLELEHPRELLPALTRVRGHQMNIALTAYSREVQAPRRKLARRISIPGSTNRSATMRKTTLALGGALALLLTAASAQAAPAPSGTLAIGANGAGTVEKAHWRRHHHHHWRYRYYRRHHHHHHRYRHHRHRHWW